MYAYVHIQKTTLKSYIQIPVYVSLGSLVEINYVHLFKYSIIISIQELFIGLFNFQLILYTPLHYKRQIIVLFKNLHTIIW